MRPTVRKKHGKHTKTPPHHSHLLSHPPHYDTVNYLGINVLSDIHLHVSDVVGGSCRTFHSSDTIKKEIGWRKKGENTDEHSKYCGF